ncbi:hypothetical protein ACHAXR_008789 [Thalassiosira sp. AJA248-18]
MVISSGKKKNRRTIKLTCIGAILLAMYVIFVYLILLTFGNGDGDNNDDGNASSSSSSSSNLRPQHDATAKLVEEEKKKKELTIDDFCGLCQWRDQGFNCNERVEWVVKAKDQTLDEAKKSNLKYCTNPNGCNNGKIDSDTGYMQCEEQDTGPNGPPADYKVGTMKHVQKEPELEAILSGALLKEATSHEITIGGSIIKNKKNEEGMRDRRTGDDIVASVLTAAKYGDREYDTKENAEFKQPGEGGGGGRQPDMPVLTAFCEPVNQTMWETKPLPTRSGPATKNSLFPISYPHVQSCSALPSQWPTDTPPVDLDPFLPWIHDVFPSSDGKYVVFVAQNRRRCYNGQRRVQRGEKVPKGVTAHKDYIHIDYGKNYFMRPQSALFQHVPVKRILQSSENTGDQEHDAEEPRYRLSSHEEADADGMETRFICRFKSFDPNATPKLSIVGYSLSKHEVDYDYHTYRKGYKFSATEAGYDNHMIWQSQLLFKCPVPLAFHEKVQSGDTVVDDYSTLYVDVIPIRTAPRYTPPREFLQPKYDFHNDIEHLFIPDIEWGKEHVLPKIDESGRWENIPICMPSLMAHNIVPKGVDVNTQTIPENESDKKYVAITGDLPPKIHKVIACTWASTTFRTRSNRAQVGDGKRRLQEWLEFNLLSGFDHIYVYDNSGAFTNEDSLADIIGLFPPDRVTRVDWPCKICSNRDGNEGERSSQYAAESSCRLRFGTHARWLGSFDTDEYLVPMGDFNSMGEVADNLDENGVKVAVFKSSPAKPRFNLLQSPEETHQHDGSFTPTVPEDETFLHTYNCNWEQFPRKNDLSHRRKQMYRADYVKLHYVHYSTITVVSQMTEKETRSTKESWMHRYVERHVHEFDEMREATMLHTKTKVARNMLWWETRCKQSTLIEGHCHVGFPFPKDMLDMIEVDKDGVNRVKDGVNMAGSRWHSSNGYAYNCFLNEKIEDHWWPKLVEAVKRRNENTKLQ